MEGSSSVHGQLPESIAPLERKLNDHVYQLYKAKGKPTLEIVFFHGLQCGHGADAYRSTWTSGNGPSQQVWPATWLAEEFPDSHIFSMSYDSRLDLHNLAENLMRPGIGQGCPVILVGHSFGGLVIKALCATAYQTCSRNPPSETNRKIERFLHNVAGFFFYATPHQGIHSVGKLAGYLLDGPNDGPLLDYVKSLSADSARLDHHFTNVKSKYKAWHIASAGESLPTTWGRFNDLVVPEASARYGDQFTMIKADHISICKPSGKTSYSFQHLINWITTVQEDDNMGQAITSPLPFGRDKRYVSFRGSINHVQKALENECENHVVTVYGAPGSGKTSLVKNIALDYQPHHKPDVSREVFSVAVFPNGVVFLPCGKGADCRIPELQHCLFESLGCGSMNMAEKRDGEHEVIPGFRRRLQVELRKLKALIILDDVWERRVMEEFILSPYEAIFVKYLITSQIKDIWPDATKVLMGRPTYKEARQILVQYMEINTDFPENIKGIADSLIDRVDFHPLTLANIGLGMRQGEAHEPGSRKYIPMFSIKQRGTGIDLANDGLPEDGFTWRKYGQKKSLGSKYPRSYYFCSGKNDYNCPVRKWLQRSDEDPSMFDAKYCGTHTCQPHRQYPSLPFSVPSELFNRVLAEPRGSPHTRELCLQDLSGRGGSGIDPIEGLSPTLALPIGMGTSVTPDVKNPSQQRISNIVNTSTDNILESTPNILLKKSRPFPTLTLSGGQSEEHSSILTDNSMRLPAAARMDNQNAQTKKEDIEWESGVSQHVKTQAETSSVEATRFGRPKAETSRVAATRSGRPKPASESIVECNDSGSNSSVIHMGPMKQEYETLIGDFQIRSDIQTLGFKSWDQKFNPHKMLLLCDSKSSNQGANVLFFHAEAMATLFGVGVAFSKVSIVFSEQLGYEIWIEEVMEEAWKSYWMYSCENTWQPVLFERGNEILENTKKRSVTRDEALSRFGICVDGVEAQEFMKLNNSNSHGLEDANNYHPKWIKLFMDLVLHARRCNRAHPNRNDDEQMVEEGLVEEGLWNHMYHPVREDCHEKRVGAVLSSTEGGLLNSHDHDHSFHEGQNDKVDRLLHIAPQRIDTNYITIPGKADMMCDRGSKGPDGSSCHETGDGQTLQGSKEGSPRKRKHSGEGHLSIGGKAALKSGVKVKEWEAKKVLKVNVVFLHSRCDLYRQNSSTGILEQTIATAGMPHSSIKPTLVVEFKYNPGGVNSLETTLGSEFQFDNEKPSCQAGWYQDEFKLSFQHSAAEHFDVDPVCDVDSHRIISNVVHGDLEVTRQSERACSELVEHNVSGSGGLQFGWVGFTPSVSGSRRREDSKQRNDSNQHVIKVGTCRLSDNPSIAITSACKSRILEYKLHSLIDPVMPDNRQWKDIKAMGMYSNFEIKVAGQWYIFEEEKETYEFSVKKKLSRYINLGGADVVPNGNASAGGGAIPVQNINYPGGSDAAQQTVSQIFTRKFILNHNFSEFFESLKRPDPYTWVLRDSSNRGNQVPTAIKLSDP